MRNKLLAVLIALTGFAALAAVPVTTAQAASSRATTVTKTAPTKTCPPGSSNVSYCTESCPSGTTLVSNYCESCPSGTAVGDYCESCPSGTAVGTYCENCPSGTAVGDYCESCPSGTVGKYCEDCPKGTTAVGDYCESSTTFGAALTPTVYDWALWGAGKRHFHGPALKFKVKRGLSGGALTSLTCKLPSGLTFASTAAKNAKVSFKGIKTTKTTLSVKLGSVGSVLIYLKNHSMVESKTLRKEIMAGKVKTLTFNLSVTNAAGTTTKLAFNTKTGA